MDGKNPCDVCPKKNRASECSGCALDQHSTGECGNYDCFLHYKCGCLIGLDDLCGASDCYEDDIYDHNCDECVNCRSEDDGTFICEVTGDEVSKWDTACESFIERDGG